MKIKQLADFPPNALVYIKAEDVVFTAYYQNINMAWVPIASAPSAKLLSTWLFERAGDNLKIVHQYDHRLEPY